MPRDTISPEIQNEINKELIKDFWRDVERSVFLYLKDINSRWADLPDEEIEEVSSRLREKIIDNLSLVRVMKTLYSNWDGETLSVDISGETEIAQFFDDGKPLLMRSIILDFGNDINKELDVYYDENGKKIVDN